MRIIVIILTVVSFLFISFHSLAQNKANVHLRDGLYLIEKLGNDTTRFASLTAKDLVINFNHMFIENNEQEFTRLLIDTTEFVPLELEKLPTTEQQTLLKKKLLLTLTKEASTKLKSFTARHVMSKVALVVDGEAVTIHKIREAITSGQLQITRCNDNACEHLVIKLKDNVKNEPNIPVR
jgi:hypothetical protein